MKTIIVMIMLALLLVACGGRHIVAHPNDVTSLNSADWEVTSEPSKD